MSDVLYDVRRAYHHLLNDPPNSVSTMRAVAALDAAATEIQRLQGSIDSCSTEEGLCYAKELERVRTELRECRGHLTSVMTSPDRPTIKAAADWLANWDGNRVDTSGYSQKYADQMRTALLRIQGIALEPGQQGNRETQIQNIACLVSGGLLGVQHQ